MWNQKWYATDAEKRISEIQGFLDLSIQRSSCERDDYKDRIYLYFKEEHKISLSVSTIGTYMIWIEFLSLCLPHLYLVYLHFDLC